MGAYERAELLYDHHRYEEAAAMLRAHLAAEPEDAHAHALLARAMLEIKGERKGALETIDSALALDAEEPFFFGIRALVLCKLDRYKEALQAAEEAIRLDAGDEFGWIVKAQALGGQSRWEEAEEATRQALAIDPDDENALNLRSIYLRMQGRVEESTIGNQQRLERDPEDPTAHANSGWAALHSGDRKKAEEHFREALRLEPESEYARMGLRECFKSRSVLYRLFLKWVFFMQRFTEKQRWLILIGLYVGFRFGRAVLAAIHPLLAIALVVVYLFFCFGSFLASGMGHWIMLIDRTARLTLTGREKLDGLVVGGLFYLGLLIVILGATVLPPACLFLGGGLAVGAIPASQIFLNESRAGWAVFGSLAALAYLAGIVGFFVALGGRDPFEVHPSGLILSLALLGGILSTWISGLSSLHSDAEH